tara:strand:- start:355 stop:528 length:174 start_codon:yes stop_codon:yes gene_type:complete
MWEGREREGEEEVTFRVVTVKEIMFLEARDHVAPINPQIEHLYIPSICIKTDRQIDR